MPESPPHGTALFVRNLEKNLEYFTEILGFTPVERDEDEAGNVRSASVKFGRGANAAGVTLMSIPHLVERGVDYDFGEFGHNLERGALGNGVVLYFRVPDVDKFHERIRANGAIIDEPPSDTPWGTRAISVLTPEGHYLTFHKELRGGARGTARGRRAGAGTRTGTPSRTRGTRKAGKGTSRKASSRKTTRGAGTRRTTRAGR